MSVRTVVWASWYLGLYSFGYGKLESALERATDLYRGVPEAELEAQTRAWFRTEVAHHLRSGAAACLHEHRARGDELVLCTSSSIYMARAASDAWNLDGCIATEFEVEDGCMTGRISKMGYGHHKLTRARAWVDARGIDLADCSFYTDSYTDRDLLRAVGHPIVIAPDRRLARLAVEQGWPTVQWGPRRS